MVARHSILLGLLMLFLASCGSMDAPHRIIRGVLDLEQYDFAGSGPLDLRGDWDMWWIPTIDVQVLEAGPPLLDSLGEQKTSMNLPSYWNSKVLPGKPLGMSKGWAYYRVKVKLPMVGGQVRRYAIEIPEIRSAYVLWVNGELIATGGRVGRSSTEELPALGVSTHEFSVRGQEAELVFLVSNFHHLNGGIAVSPRFGSPQTIKSSFITRTVLSAGTMFALILVGLYHLLLYVLRPKDFYNLFFGLFCIAFGFKAAFDGNKIILDLFPFLSWENYIRFWIMTGVMGGPLFLWFLTHLYPRENFKPLTQGISLFMLGYVALLFMFGPQVYEYLELPYYLVALILVVYALAILIKATVFHREHALGTLLMGAFAGFAVIYDVFIALELIHGSMTLAPFGMLGFVLYQASIIALRSTNNFNEVIRLGLELKRSNITLEHKIQERTRQLEDQMQEVRSLSIKDHLTGTVNRRKLDGLIQDELERSLRSKRPFSVLLFDLDHFKTINDNLGHNQGDKVLMEVSSLVQKSLRKVDTLGRWGGDEFLVILPDTDGPHAYQAGERIRQEVYNVHTGRQYPVGISVGWATWKVDDTKESLIIRADKGLYASKLAGRNCTNPPA